jgi:hypothetical protein
VGKIPIKERVKQVIFHIAAHRNGEKTGAIELARPNAKSLGFRV